MTSTPLRIKMLMTAPRSCTGWECSCVAPYGFGEGRNSICHFYGPGADVDPKELAKYHRALRAVWLRKEWKNKEYVAPLATYKAEQHREKMMEKIRSWLDWELDFEDQVRTQGFFEARERQRAYEADAPARARRESWERWRDSELASSARSIQTLNFDGY